MSKERKRMLEDEANLIKNYECVDGIKDKKFPAMVSVYMPLRAIKYLNERIRAYDRLLNEAHSLMTSDENEGCYDRKELYKNYEDAVGERYDLRVKRYKMTRKMYRDFCTLSGEGLYNRLWKWRQRVAHTENKPPHIILQRVTMLGIACQKPWKKWELLTVYGFKKETLDRYGDDILKIVKNHVEWKTEKDWNYVAPATKRLSKKTLLKDIRTYFDDLEKS